MVYGSENLGVRRGSPSNTQDQCSVSSLGQTTRPDYRTADREGSGSRRDLTSRGSEINQAIAEIQIIGASECEVATPGLEIIRGHRDGCARRIVDRASIDGQRTVAQRMSMVDVQCPGIQGQPIRRLAKIVYSVQCERPTSFLEHGASTADD